MNQEVVDHQQVLKKVVNLPVYRWSYKADKSHARHLGPMAQDFHSTFEVGKDERHIGSLDASGVSLSAIKALHENAQHQVVEKNRQIELLHSEIDSIKRENEELHDRLNSLESALLDLMSRLESRER